MLGLRFCARAFSSCGKWGPLFIVVCGPLTIAASLVAEHRLQTRRLSSCGSRAQLLRGMWNLPRPGLEPVSPALAGGFLTTAPPGKPPPHYFLNPILSDKLQICIFITLRSLTFLTNPFNSPFRAPPEMQLTLFQLMTVFLEHLCFSIGFQALLLCLLGWDVAEKPVVRTYWCYVEQPVFENVLDCYSEVKNTRGRSCSEIHLVRLFTSSDGRGEI